MLILPSSCLIATLLCFQGAVEVEGDSALLNKVASVQASFREELICGDWSGRVFSGGMDAKIDFKWNVDDCRIDFDLEPSEMLGGRQRGVAVRHRHTQSVFYNDKLMALEFDGIAKEFPPPLECHPRKWWYSFQALLPWERLLDASDPQGDVKQFVVSESESGVLIERHHGDGSIINVTASRQLGFRITSYSSVDPPEGENIYEGTYEWEQNSDGIYYPTKIRHLRYKRGADKSVPFFQCEISRFSNRPVDAGRPHVNCLEKRHTIDQACLQTIPASFSCL